MSQHFMDVMHRIAATEAVIGVHRKQSDSVFFEVRTGEGRSQVVMATLVVTPEDEEIVHMMSEIGPTRPGLHETMLRKNLNLRYSRIAILDNDGDASYALVYSYPFSELEPVELAKAFGELAFMADGIERECFSVDRM